jgi:hypothetical protein
MRNRLILLGLAAMVTAMFALPAVASAGEWSIHNAAGTNPEFTASSANPRLTANGQPNINCATSSATGAHTSPTTGNITLTVQGCTESFTGSSCTSPGQPAGTITTGPHVFHNVHLEPKATNTNAIGVLITGEGSFAHFTCKPFGASTTITVTGNIIGEVTSPTCAGAPSTTSTVVFGTKAGEKEPTQKWEQVTTSGTIYDLVADVTVFGSTSENTAAEDATGTLTFTNGAVTATCV